MMELVSIIVPVYNAERFLEEGVASMMAQDYPNLEFIFVDDCSTDNSLAKERVINKCALCTPKITIFNW